MKKKRLGGKARGGQKEERKGDVWACPLLSLLIRGEKKMWPSSLTMPVPSRVQKAKEKGLRIADS